MRKLLLTFIAFACLHILQAQAPEDVLRYSFNPAHGAARNLAIGGAMGSLGGDISALYSNPAGLGLYKTSEVVLSPGLKMNNNKFNYRGTNSSADKSGFDIGTSGFVFGFNTPNSKWTSQAFSIGINQTANFNNVLSYNGRNTNSSYTEVFTEEISNSRLNFNQILNNSAYAFGSAPALYTYLVDTFRNASNQLVVKGLPEFLLDKGIALQQQKTITTSGGSYEVALGYAANMEDKLYIGGGIGISFLNYKRHTYYKESDPTQDKNNNFDYFELNDYTSTKGAGLDAKIGLIYKPQDQVRIGLALQTPTFYSFTDKESSNLKSSTEGYNGVASAESSSFTGGQEGLTTYNASTPWKATVSGSYVFREINDTRKQKAFITADVEYVGYNTAGFSSGSNGSTSDEAYYEDLKTTIKDSYKGAINFRLGGELKFNTWMVRAGGAYYGNPYSSSALKADKKIISTGIGYRDHGIFVDLTYAHTLNKDVNFPYRLQDKQNTFAEQTGYAGNLMLTMGFKL